MRLATFLLLFALISCGNMEEPPQGPLNEVITADPQPVRPGTYDHANLTAICQSLDHLESRLGVLVTSKYAFNYSEKGCSDDSQGTATNLNVSIQYSGGEYIFTKDDSDLFGFPYVAATSNGAIEDICRSLNSDLTNPHMAGREIIAFSTASSRECVSDANHICLAIGQAGEDRVVHTKEWIKFKVRDARRGFFVERWLKSSADCAEKEWIERRAVLL